MQLLIILWIIEYLRGLISLELLLFFIRKTLYLKSIFNCFIIIHLIKILYFNRLLNIILLIILIYLTLDICKQCNFICNIVIILHFFIFIRNIFVLLIFIFWRYILYLIIFIIHILFLILKNITLSFNLKIILIIFQLNFSPIKLDLYLCLLLCQWL
jgi:hypothetical protein